MADDFKAEGNALFKAGEFKKAAVAYTKGIKADPSNHILYSNRCAAFLKMLKVSRALRDAETCIELAPGWAKGYYRKAKVLEATEGRAGEAYDVVVAGLEASPDNADLKNLHRSYTKSRNAAAKRKERERAFAAAALGGSDGGGDQGGASVAATAAVAAETMSQIDLSDMSSGATALTGEQVRFIREIATEIAAGFAEHTDANELFRPSCYLRNNGAEDEDFFQIAVERAFLSPELHYEATEYLRGMCVEHTSDYALLAIHKPVVKYPMRWTERGASWPFAADRDGLFIQIEVKSAGTTGVPARHVLFFPRSTTDYTIDVEKPYHCDIDRYAFFPPLFR